MPGPYEKDRRVLAYALVAVILMVVGYLGILRPEALNPTIAAFFVSVLIVVLALVGVRNPLKEPKDDKPDQPRPSYLERLAGREEQGDHDQGEARGPGRNDRRGGLRWFGLADPANQCA